MKRISWTAALVLFVVFGTIGESQAVTIYFADWTTSGPITSFSFSGPVPNVALSGTLNGLAPVDIVVPMLFGGTGPEYAFAITLLNQTSSEWTDFHFETGYGTGSAYERSSGQDQPLFLTNISSDRFASSSLIPGTGEGGTPAWGIYDIGIDWFDGTVPVGQAVTLLFTFQAIDNIGSPMAPPTQWNADSYPFTGPNGEEGFLETLRIFATTAQATPEPSAMLLFLSGLSGLCAFRRRSR